MTIPVGTPLTCEEAERLARLAEANFLACDEADRSSHFAFARSLRLRGEEHQRLSVAIFKAIAARVDVGEVAAGLGFAGVLVVLFGWWIGAPQ